MVAQLVERMAKKKVVLKAVPKVETMDRMKAD